MARPYAAMPESLLPQIEILRKWFRMAISDREKVPHKQLPHSNSTDNLERLISNHIKSVVERTNGKVHGPGGAAEILGVNPSSLRGKMRKYGIKHGRRFKRQV